MGSYAALTRGQRIATLADRIGSTRGADGPPLPVLSRWPTPSPSPKRSRARPRRRHRRARGLHAPDPERRRARADPPGAARPDARADDARRDLRPADRDGLRAEARLLVGRQPGRRLAAPPARRGRARLAGAARDRGALARGHGGGVRGGRGEPAVRRAARLRAAAISPARTRVATIVCPFTGEELAAVPAHRPDVGIVHAQQADRHGNVQLWGITGVQKETVLASARSIVTVEEIVDELEPRPGGVVLPGWVIDAVAVAPRRRAPVVRARLLRPRQRLLRRLGRDQPRPRHVHALDAARRARARGLVEARREPTAITADEMMAVEAARRLANDNVCFVGIGLPSLAANLARRTHAPGCVLVYESGTIGAKPTQLPLSIGDGELAETADAVVSVPGDVRVLAPGRPDRRRLPRRGADRPARQPQQHGDRRLRHADGAAARRRRRAGDRDLASPTSS